jgi:hypothetical protein
MKNLLLFVFDILVLPITLIRLILIYLYGSRYGINGLNFIDVMMHSENKYFNQQEDIITVDTINSDIRCVINDESMIEHNKLINMPNNNIDSVQILNKQNIPLLDNNVNSVQILNKQNIPLLDNNVNSVQILNKQNIPLLDNNNEKEKVEFALSNVEKIIAEEMKHVNNIFTENNSDDN